MNQLHHRQILITWALFQMEIEWMYQLAITICKELKLIKQQNIILNTTNKILELTFH